MKKKLDKKKTSKPKVDVSNLMDRISSENKERIAYHLANVLKTTGSILVEDVMYCIELDERIKKHALRTAAL